MGTYVYTFKNQLILKDDDLNQWYTDLASYIDLPHEIGIQTVAFMPLPRTNTQPVSPRFSRRCYSKGSQWF